MGKKSRAIGGDGLLDELGCLTAKLDIAEQNFQTALQHLKLVLSVVHSSVEQWGSEDRQIIQEARKFIISFTEPTGKG